MTACVNKRRALAAALAGVLALGGGLALAVPTLALADEGASLQFASGELTNGTLENLTVAGAVQTAASNAVSVTATGKAQAVTAATVTLADARTLQVADPDAIEVYKADSDGNATGTALDGDAVTDPGTYVVRITDKNYTDQALDAKLIVNPATFGTIAWHEGDNSADTTLIYDGSALDVVVTNGGNALRLNKDYTVSFYNADTKATTTTVKDAGSYRATVTGIGMYAGQQAQVAFVVYKFDLSSAAITIDPFTDLNAAQVTKVTTPVAAGDEQYAELDASLVDLALVADSDGYGPRSYEASSADKNVTGTQTVEGVRVKSLATFQYDGKAVSDMEFVKTKGEKFDLSKLDAVVNGKVVIDGQTNASTWVAGKITYTVKDASGADITPSVSFTTAGVYYVTVSASSYNPAATSAATDFSYAGSATFKVTVYRDEIDADKQIYVYDVANKKAVSSYTKVYDGTPVTVGLLDDGSCTLCISAGQDANSTPNWIVNNITYKLYDADGNDITASGATNAGTYTLKVTSSKYKLTGTTEMTITVSPLDLTKLTLVDGTTPANVQTENGVRYATEGVSVSEYGAAYSFTSDTKWSSVISLPNVTKTLQAWDSAKSEWVPATGNIADGGKYRVLVTVDESADGNYTTQDEDAETSELVFYGIPTGGLRFDDVTPDQWYYGKVNAAAATGVNYMNGYSGTNIFGPNNTLTRAQAAQVLYNMATRIGFTDETKGSYTKDKGYVTGFSDVDGTMWYAQAILWAEQTGVVNGYGESGTFGPNDPVTREQFATMLARYAQACKNYRDGSGKKLSEMSDASAVSNWAEESVNWATTNGIMGSNDWVAPQNSISRAEVAKMIMVYDALK